MEGIRGKGKGKGKVGKESLMPTFPFPMPKTKGFFKVFGYTHTR